LSAVTRQLLLPTISKACIESPSADIALPLHRRGPGNCRAGWII
jgi:hypothetical protein